MQDPLRGVEVADGGDYARAEVAVEYQPGIGFFFWCGVEYALKGKTAAGDEVGWCAEDARGLRLVEVETTDILAGQYAEGEEARMQVGG